MINRNILIQRFCEECVWVWSVREHFRELFEKGDERLNLLTEVADGFFKDLNTILSEYIILQICKITDPSHSARNGGNKSLTVEYICGMDWPDETKAELKDLADEIAKFRKKVEKARNKVIAHADVKTYIQNIALGEFNQEDEEKFWEALQKFVDLVYDKTFSGPFPINATLSGDAISLIAMLKDAAYFDDLVKKDSKLLINRFRNDRYENA